MPAMSSTTNTFDFNKMQPEVNSILGINNLNSLLNDDDDDDAIHTHQQNGVNELLHMETNGDGFPLLRRRGDEDSMQATDDEPQSNGWSNVHRHRAGQQSLPWNSLRNSQHEDLNGGIFGSTVQKVSTNNRRSMDAFTSFLPETSSKRSSMQSLNNGYSNGVPKLQSSYSTNDIPTVKNNGFHEQNANTGANMTHAEQHLHNHNASMGRVPMTASNRQSRDFSYGEPRVEENGMAPLSSALQANAPAFQGLPLAVTTNAVALNGLSTAMPPAYNQTNGYFHGYNNNMQMLNMGMNGMNLGAQNDWANNSAYNQQYNGYGAGPVASYGGNYGQSRFNPPDSQRNVMKARKGEDGR